MQSILDSAKQKVSQDIQGLVGEYIPAITEEVLQAAIAAGVTNSLADLKKWAQNFTIGKDILSNKVVGNVRSNKVVPANTIIRQKGFAGQDVATLHDIKLESNWTQDKVDIVLTLPGDEKINASVKNVHLNSNTWIHILSGTSLLKMLVDYPEFANHYLNITADLGRGRRGPDQRPSANLIKNAHDAIRLTIGLHSLVGGMWADRGGGNIGKTDTAELFVVNNANIGKYQVYFISDMMKALYQDIDLLKIQDFGRVGWTNIYKEDFQNGDTPNYKNAYARIAMILMQLHKQHLEVSISSKILS